MLVAVSATIGSTEIPRSVDVTLDRHQWEELCYSVDEPTSPDWTTGRGVPADGQNDLGVGVAELVERAGLAQYAALLMGVFEKGHHPPWQPPGQR